MKINTLLFAAAFLFSMAAMPSLIHAQCASWNASGKVQIVQRGSNYPVDLTLQQNGKVLTGKAVYQAYEKQSGFFQQFKDYKRIDGTVDGTIEGNSFKIQIFWPEGLTGVYNATVLPSGRLDGQTYDKNNSRIKQTWHSYGAIKCATSETTAPVKPASPPPLKKTGKAPKPAGPPTPMNVPGITASTVVFQSLNHPLGIVVLNWDGGADHPYAEVWVKVNGGKETFVVEKGKGSMQVQVQRGNSYTYILTDAGKTISTVGFVAQ